MLLLPQRPDKTAQSGKIILQTGKNFSDGNPTGYPTESANLDLSELSETEPPTEEYIQAWMRPRIYVADGQLSIHVSPPKAAVETFPEAVVSVTSNSCLV